MAVETLLAFNGNAAYNALGDAIAQVINDLCQTVLSSAQANLGGEYPSVEATLQSSLSSLISTGLITGQIGTDDWQAWIAEWGSGSEADVSNPDLTAYMDSETWNPMRNGFNITGRPEGPYIGLDGQMHDEHSGKLAGVNLEELSMYDVTFQVWMSKVGLSPDAFQPKVPLHFMRDALESNRKLIMDQLNGVIETFRFGDFFV